MELLRDIITLHPERDYYKKERRLGEFDIKRTVKGIES